MTTASRRPHATPCAEPPRRPLAAGALALLAACALVGCQKPLFSPSEERTPFDRFDAMRNQQAPQYVEDEYGRRQPNLRSRLLPRN